MFILPQRANLADWERGLDRNIGQYVLSQRINLADEGHVRSIRCRYRFDAATARILAMPAWREVRMEGSHPSLKRANIHYL